MSVIDGWETSGVLSLRPDCRCRNSLTKWKLAGSSSKRDTSPDLYYICQVGWGQLTGEIAQARL